MNWTQPICGRCYRIREPGREPHRMKEELVEIEVCCDCGQPNKSGIYYRVDPRTVKYPQSQSEADEISSRQAARAEEKT